MRRSDIFDAYAKIAEETGLISLSEEEDENESQHDKPKESTKLKKYKKSPHPRVGSDDISTIEALYGVKQESVNKYEFNIMEAADPRPVVISPSYDRINGLVENNVERQNIIMNIIYKPNDTNNNYRKYAKKELILELVRLANDLDNAGHEELRKIADRCIEEIGSEKKKFKTADVGDWLKSKEDWISEKGHDIFQTVKDYGTGALIGGVLGGIVGAIAGEGVGAIPGFMYGVRLGGVAGGLTAAIARTAPQVKNVSANAKDSISQIDDLKAKLPQAVQRTFLDGFEKELQNLSNLATEYSDLVSIIEETHPNSTQEDAENAHNTTTNLLDSMQKVDKYTSAFNDRVKRSVYQEFVTHNKVLTPLYNLINDDVEDVVDSLKSLSTAMNNLKNSMSEAHQETKEVVENAKEEKPVEKATEPESEELNEEEPEEGGIYSDVMKYLGHQPSDRELEFFRSLK